MVPKHTAHSTQQHTASAHSLKFKTDTLRSYQLLSMGWVVWHWTTIQRLMQQKWLFVALRKFMQNALGSGWRSWRARAAALKRQSILIRVVLRKLRELKLCQVWLLPSAHGTPITTHSSWHTHHIACSTRVKAWCTHLHSTQHLPKAYSSAQLETNSMVQAWRQWQSATVLAARRRAGLSVGWVLWRWHTSERINNAEHMHHAVVR